MPGIQLGTYVQNEGKALFQLVKEKLFLSAVTQNQPVMVEIKGFKTSHSMGAKTALLDPITAGAEGHADCPEK